MLLLGLIPANGWKNVIAPLGSTCLRIVVVRMWSYWARHTSHCSLGTWGLWRHARSNQCRGGQRLHVTDAREFTAPFIAWYKNFKLDTRIPWNQATTPTLLQKSVPLTTVIQSYLIWSNLIKINQIRLDLKTGSFKQNFKTKSRIRIIVFAAAEVLYIANSWKET